MSKLPAFALISLFSITPFALRAQDAPQDAEGCRDSSLVTRMGGSTVQTCDNKEYEQLDIKVGADKTRGGRAALMVLRHTRRRQRDPGLSQP